MRPVTDEANPLYFIAHRGHMRRLQPSVLTGVNVWKGRRVNVDCISDIVVLGWPQFVTAIDSGNSVATP